MKRIVAALFVLATLAACATGPRYVTSNVTQYHSLVGVPTGRTFAIVAIDDDQKSSIQYRQHADAINAALTARGMQQYTGSDPTRADYVVNLSYSVQGPHTEVRWMPSGHWGFGMGYGGGYWGRPWGWGPWGRRWGWGPRWGWGFGYSSFYDPFYDPWYARTRNVWVRRVELDMYEGDTYATDDKEKVFEGRALSEGYSPNIDSVMPYMIEAVLDQFPGQHGRSRTVRVQIPEPAPGTSARAY
jgi:hypothetical protein